MRNLRSKNLDVEDAQRLNSYFKEISGFLKPSSCCFSRVWQSHKSIPASEYCRSIRPPEPVTLQVFRPTGPSELIFKTPRESRGIINGNFTYLLVIIDSNCSLVYPNLHIHI